MTEYSENKYREDLEKVNKIANELYREFQHFISINEPKVIEDEDVIVSKTSLAEIVLRVDKRKSYYVFFHNLEHISEFKEAALYAFWVIKLKPFKMLNTSSQLADTINEYFAIHLILLTIKECCSQKKKIYIHPCKSFIENAVYSFTFQDISKEALILFVETLAFAYDIYPTE